MDELALDGRPVGKLELDCFLPKCALARALLRQLGDACVIEGRIPSLELPYLRTTFLRNGGEREVVGLVVDGERRQALAAIKPERLWQWASVRKGTLVGEARVV